jgi:uncharacterized protein YbcI
MEDGAQRVEPAEGVQSQISREMVRIYKVQFGRGPTRAQTRICDDMIICTLEDSQTPAERNLARLGEHQRLRDTRMFFQYASEPEFRKAIEELTGRTVRAFVSGIDVEQDVSAEVFYLDPKEP